MRKDFGILALLVVALVTLGCDEDDGPHFVEPPAGKVPTADYRIDDTPRDGLPEAIRTHTAASRGGFTLPTTPISQACSILDGGVRTPTFSSYWNSCREAPLWTIEATVEGILRDLSVFWNSDFVPCDCSDIDPQCRLNAFASRLAPGFIWYDDALVNLMSEGESLIPVAYLMAHEAAHHIQFQHGYRFSLPIVAELSADCMAGYFLGYLACTGQVDGVDVEASMTAICEGGDLPSTPWWSENAHGTCEARVIMTISGVSGYALRVPPRDWCSE